MSKHPLARRARRLASRTRERGQAYADGMFFFTRPVGAPINYPEGRGENRNMSPRGEYAVTTGYTSGGEFLGDYYADGANTRSGGYGDGAFYFLQKFGQPAGGYGDVAMVQAPPAYGDVAMNIPADEPQVIRMGFAGAVEAQYGAAGDRPGKLPEVRGMVPDVKGASSGRPTGRSQTAVPGGTPPEVAVARPEVVAAFEAAAFAYGREKFWADFWNAQRGDLSDVSKQEKAAASSKAASAKSALDSTAAELLRDLPFSREYTNKGQPTNEPTRLFDAYQNDLIAEGYYDQVFRNVESNGKRRYSGTMAKAIFRDIIKPLAKKQWKNHERKGDQTLVFSKVDLDPYVSRARDYFLADPQSYIVEGTDASAQAQTYKDVLGTAGLRVTEGRGDYELDFPEQYSDSNYRTKEDRLEATYIYAGKKLNPKLFTKNLNAVLKTARDKQVVARDALTARLPSVRAAWEATRKEIVEKAVAKERATAQVVQAKNTATNVARNAENAADRAKTKRTEAETKALGLDVAGTEAASAASLQAAKDADAAAKQAESALASTAAAFRTLGDSGTSEKAALDAIVRSARVEAEQAAIDAQSTVARIEAAKAGKKAADDKAAAESAARVVEAAQQGVDAAQRNLDAAKAKLAKIQEEQAALQAAKATMAPAQFAQREAQLAQQAMAAQAEVAAAERALGEATDKLALAKGEQVRRDQAAQQSEQKANDLNKRAEDIGAQVPESKVPPGAVQPRLKGPMRKVETDKSAQAGGEGFFSKYSTELILGGAVLAIGGYFAWKKYGNKL